MTEKHRNQSTTNYENVCRGCLSIEENVALYSLNELEIREKFQLCTRLEITDLDDLPENICEFCWTKCENWFAFKTLCTTSDQLLRENKVKPEDMTITIIELSVENSSQTHEDVETNDNDAETFNDEYTTMVIGSPDTEDKPEIIKIENKSDKETKINRSKSKLECQTCSKTFMKAERLEAHMRIHLGKKPEVCKVCQKEFNNARALRRHRNKHIDLKQYVCQVCGKTYKFATSLALHRKFHENVRRYVCDLCGKSFVRAHGLQSHMITHTEETPFECNECGKRFKNRIMLRNHQIRHEGIKKFVCLQCGKTFTTSAELTTHDRSHSGLKPFECSACDKSYKTKSHLAVHMRIHTGSRPYSCDLCPLTFAHNKVLKQHRLTHTNEKPFVCGVCQRPFRQKSTLQVHMRTHKNLVVNEQPKDQSPPPSINSMKKRTISTETYILNPEDMSFILEKQTSNEEQTVFSLR